MFESKIVTGGSYEDGTTEYDEENVLRYRNADDAITEACNSSSGHTWDIFNPRGERIARVHVDGGVDYGVAYR